jgi:methylated-DNA-[protein]-cysteine S-methyltransferase
MYDVVLAFPRMRVAVRTRDERVTDIEYLSPSAPLVSPKSPLGEKAAKQLEAYLADPDTRFDLPLAVEGTPFQKRLWAALCEIPRGRTMTYGELAKRLGGADAAKRLGGAHAEMNRAVGQACGDNRLPIVIPCHRVVAANGIGGFAHATGGYLLEAKRWLLVHECGADAFELTP